MHRGCRAGAVSSPGSQEHGSSTPDLTEALVIEEPEEEAIAGSYIGEDYRDKAVQTAGDGDAMHEVGVQTGFEAYDSAALEAALARIE